MHELVVIPAAKWMLPYLMEADQQHFDQPWDELNWRGLLALSEADDEKEFVRVAVEKLGPNQLRMHGFAAWTRVPGTETMRLAKLAVQSGSRRNRIGLSLANIHWPKETALIADVSERNLLGQKFLRGCGWFGSYHGPADSSGDRVIRFSTTGGCDCRGPREVVAERTTTATAATKSSESKPPKEKNR